MNGILSSFCLVCIICSSLGLETPMVMEVDESFLNVSRCSAPQEMESCEKMCTDYDRNLCHHTIPTKQKFQCFCVNNAIMNLMKQKRTDPGWVPCKNEMKIRCSGFCTQINRNFLTCKQVRDAQDAVSLSRCRCTRRT